MVFKLGYGLRTSILTSLTRSKMSTLPPPPGQFAKLAEHKIHYEKVGSGDHVVFFLPGAMGTTRTDFGPQLDHMNRNKFTLLAWDPPGYGYSRPPDRTFPNDFFHRDSRVAKELLDVLGIKKCSLVGWSDGGITAIIMAAQNPHLVEKLVVIAANAYMTETDMKMYDAIIDINNLSPQMRDPLDAIYGREYFQTTWTVGINKMRDMLVRNDGDICKKETGMIKCPTLIFHGKKDPLMPAFHPKFIRDTVKNSRIIEYEHGKHNLHLRYAEQFNKDVEEFLQEPKSHL